MIRPILTWPEDGRILHTVSSPTKETPLTVIDELVRDLFDSMYAAGGVGLAAIQIGVPLQVFVMEVYGQDQVFLDPVIDAFHGTSCKMNEGCLSIPDVIEEVTRYPAMTVSACDRNGHPFTKRFENLEAQCCQHEIEHLAGIVIPDKLSPLARSRLAAKMKKRKI